MTIDITHAAWRQALEESEGLTVNDPEIFTIEELVVVLGTSERSVRRKVAKMLVDGRVTITRKVTRFPNGQHRQVTAYKLLTPPPLKKAGTKRR